MKYNLLIATRLYTFYIVQFKWLWFLIPMKIILLKHREKLRNMDFNFDAVLESMMVLCMASRAMT